MKELKREEGISKIVLVIVAAVLLVAVRILLKVMVMDDTTDIIQSANYSKFSSNGKLANAPENSASSNGNTPTNSKGNSETSVLKVGDYVNYSPATKTITTDTSKTGYTDSQTLTTEADTQWRIFSIDETTGEVLITTQGATNTDTNVYLHGATGYLHGAEELNRLCKELYSSETLTARSMTVEDINKAVGYDPTTYSGYGDEYEYTSGTFYTYQENGNTVTSETPKVASISNKVKVKQMYYFYDPSSKNTTVGNILGSSYGWLASPYVATSSSRADFCVRKARSGNVNEYFLYCAFGYLLPSSSDYSFSFSSGLRPLVSLSSKLIDIAEEGKDGTTIEKAWNLK